MERKRVISSFRSNLASYCVYVLLAAAFSAPLFLNAPAFAVEEGIAVSSDVRPLVSSDVQPAASADFALSGDAASADGPAGTVRRPVYLDADTVTYSDAIASVHAEGNVHARDNTMELYAPVADYDVNSNLLTASADESEDVVIVTSADKFHGQYLEYDTFAGRGVLTRASGKMDALFLKGNDINIIPTSEALSDKVIARKHFRLKNISEDQQIAVWKNVTGTTCDYDEPHYRLVSHKVVVIPGNRTILKSPKLYFGKRMVYKYPFDYVIRMNKRTDKFSPSIEYDSDKGVGIGTEGPVDLGDWGTLSFMAKYWTQGIFEADVRYSKEILKGLTLYASSSRLYNKDEEETLWRPQWGLAYSWSGWYARLYMSERELIETEMRPGETHRYNVWRKPEFEIVSPWLFKPSNGIGFRFTGTWGRYQDNVASVMPWINRTALAVTMSGSPDVKFWIFKPYYGADYTYYDYDNDNNNIQRVTNAWLGFAYSVGAFNFNSQYYRRWVNGSSPLSWDGYSNNELFYQTVSFPLPLSRAPAKWTLSMTGEYDFIAEELAVMWYTLTFDRHCYTWSLWMKQELTGDEEKTAGITFFINAYPEQKLSLGSN